MEKVVVKIKDTATDINWNTKESKQLLESILSLKNASEAKLFLRDLLTSQEIEEFSKRLEAARMLSNQIQYDTIIEKTGLSSTTIARISKWLKGSLGGYRLVLARLSSHRHTPLQFERGLSSLSRRNFSGGGNI